MNDKGGCRLGNDNNLQIPSSTKNPKDITGQRFGKLTALERLEEKSGTSYLWLCRCDCGNEIKVPVSRLTSGHVKSCGCLKKEIGSRCSKDIRGERFGKLTAVEPTDRREDGGSIVWKCHCDCGNDTEVSWNRLRHGRVRSCGCLSNPPPKEYIGKRFGRLTVIGYAGKLNPKTTENYWLCRCDCGNETKVGQSELQNGDTLSCGCYQKELLIEHLKLIDDTSVTILEQCKKTRANNKSGYTGVFHEKSGKWIAYISYRKKRYWLGRYDDMMDAVRARKRGEEMHDGFLEWYYREFENDDSEKMCD